MPAKVILTVIEGSLKKQNFAFEDRTICLIGRAQDCHIQLPDDKAHSTISRYHCLLDINPPQIRVRDLGSKNGTYINGALVGKRHSKQTPEEGAGMKFIDFEVSAGDEIKVGKTLFRVSLEFIRGEEAGNPPSDEIYKPIEKWARSLEDGTLNLPDMDNYRIVKQLGKGENSFVYLVSHKQAGDLMTLKVMLPKRAVSRSAEKSFLREIENAKALNHPNVVAIKNFTYCDGLFFLMVEYCDEGSVADLIEQKGGRLSVYEAVPIILQVLNGLEYAHKAELPGAKGKGLIHRALKPANILLAKAGDSRIAKISDFGLAKSFDSAGLSVKSPFGTAADIPAFMPRQQVVDFKYAKPSVDVWAAAACLYNLLSGTYPRDFSNKDPVLAVLQSDALPARDRNVLIPGRLAEVLDLALSDRPEIFFKSAAEFQRSLLRAL